MGCKAWSADHSPQQTLHAIISSSWISRLIGLLIDQLVIVYNNLINNANTRALLLGHGSVKWTPPGSNHAFFVNIVSLIA